MIRQGIGRRERCTGSSWWQSMHHVPVVFKETMAYVPRAQRHVTFRAPVPRHHTPTIWSFLPFYFTQLTRFPPWLGLLPGYFCGDVCPEWPCGLHRIFKQTVRGSERRGCKNKKVFTSKARSTNTNRSSILTCINIIHSPGTYMYMFSIWNTSTIQHTTNNCNHCNINLETN